jgi:hypothetical protein
MCLKRIVFWQFLFIIFFCIENEIFTIDAIKADINYDYLDGQNNNLISFGRKDRLPFIKNLQQQMNQNQNQINKEIGNMS